MELPALAGHLLLLFTAVVEPVIGVLTHRDLKRQLPTDRGARLRFYRRLIAVEWAWVPVVVFAVSNHPDPFRLLGLTWPSGGRLAAIVAGGLIVAIGVQTGFLVRFRASLLSSPAARRALEPVALILPRSAVEQHWWVVVSATAGVCEEILYRGFLFYYLQVVLQLPPVVTVLASSGLFALAHSYQGPRAVATTALLSTTLGLVYYLTGSLLVPIILHFTMDVRSVLLAPYLDHATGMVTRSPSPSETDA
jgi:uncharacterized protein